MVDFRFAALCALMIGAPAAHAARPLLAPPIAEAALGQVQCYAPDAVRKTCQSIAAYRPGAHGGIDNIALVLIAPNPVIVMRTISPVTIKAGQVCGPMRPEDIEAASFTINGLPADPVQSARLRQQMLVAVKTYLGHEICTAYLPDGDALRASEKIDGAPRPALDQRVAWVSAAGGYQVRP